RHETGRARLAHARRFDISHGAGHAIICERKARPGRQQFSSGGDQRTAVINHAPGLVAQQVAIEVSNAEGARAFRHKTLADVDLAERKVTGARVENHVDTVERQTGARTLGNPRVFADLETNAHTTAIEIDIAQRIARAIQRDLGSHAGRPGLKPARLVVNAIAGEKLLGGKAQYFSVG